MNEEPKSIWKKSWTGWGWLWAWLILAVATFFIVLIIALLTPGGSRNLGATLGASAAISVVAIVFVGLLAFIHWLCSWKNFRRFLFACACLATLIALVYAEEDWRGWHAWNKFKHDWEAKGEKFDFASVVPSSVPDDQNFAFSPVWIAEMKYNFLKTPKRAEAWYGNRIYSEEVSKILPLLPVSVSGLTGTNWWSAEYSPNFPKVSGQWTMASLTDLKPWQSYYRGLEKTNPAVEIPIAPQPQSPAEDVLLALSKFDPAIEELRQASQLPYSRFPLNYDTEYPGAIMLPHLAALKRCAQVLQLRAIAELQNGQSENDMDDVKLSLRLADSIRTEPILISHLVRIAIVSITLQPIYEDLAEHRWSDAQLAKLDSELVKLDFLADYKLSMRGEMILCQIGDIEYLRRHPEQIPNIITGSFGGDDDNSSSPGSIISSFNPFHLIPSGWFYQNELCCARAMVQFYLPVADVNQQIVSPTMTRRAVAAVETDTRHRDPYNFLEGLFLPSLGNAVKKFACAQSSVDLARVAIALERYRLAHGEYPESLDALAPQFMEKVPHDVIGGQPSQGSGSASQPLHYRRTSDGQFVLYSIGWNERDDGGVVGLTKGGAADISKGDWVWRYPQK